LLTWPLPQNKEKMDKYVFPQIDFTFKKVRKMNLLTNL